MLVGLYYKNQRKGRLIFGDGLWVLLGVCPVDFVWCLVLDVARLSRY